MLARITTRGKCVRAISDEEIAITAALPLDRVMALSSMTDWNRVEIEEMRRFCVGCNFDPFSQKDRHRARVHLRTRNPWAYLKRSPHWHSRFRPLISRLHRRASA